jgi:hypothetical protein
MGYVPVQNEFTCKSTFINKSCLGLFQKGALVISLIGMALNLLLLSLNFIWRTYVFVVPSVCSFLCYLCLLVGNRMQKPSLYYFMLFANVSLAILTDFGQKTGLVDMTFFCKILPILMNCIFF